MIKTFKKNKDPNSVLDYQIDWSRWLEDGDAISASTWIFPAGITAVSDQFADSTTTVWVSGGTLGTRYVLTNRITTLDGRIEDAQLSLYVSNVF